jgi:hypothetical protein
VLIWQWQIAAQCTICHCGIDLSADIGKLAFSSSCNGLKNLALAIREVMSGAKRRHIPARQKSNAHRSIILWKVSLLMAGAQTQFNNFLRTTSPAFNQFAPIEDLCEQWISRARQMLTLRILIPVWLWSICLMYKRLKKTSERFSFASKDLMVGVLCVAIPDRHAFRTIYIDALNMPFFGDR